MYVLEDDLKLNAWQFSQRKYLDWETKLRLTKTRIREWDQNWDGQVYVSYSGGLDSTVLLHLVRETVGEEVPAVFSNTGLEFRRLRSLHVRRQGLMKKLPPGTGRGNGSPCGM